MGLEETRYNDPRYRSETPVQSDRMYSEGHMSSPGRFFAASFGQAAEDHTIVLGGLSRGYQRYLAEQSMGDSEKPLSEEEWKESDFYRRDIPYREGMTKGDAAVYSAMHDRRIFRNAVLNEYRGDWSGMLGFSGSIAGTIFSPENWIPLAAGSRVISGMRLAASLNQSRIGVVSSFALAGAYENAIIEAATAGIVANRLHEEGSKVAWDSFSQDVLAGIAFGGLLGGAIGGVASRGMRGKAAAHKAFVDAGLHYEEHWNFDGLDVASVPEFREIFSDTLSRVKEGSARMRENLSTRLNDLRAESRASFDAHYAQASENMSSARAAANEAFEGMSTMARSAAQDVTSKLDFVIGEVSGVSEDLGAAFSARWETGKAWLEEAMQASGTAGRKAWVHAGREFESAASGARQAAEEARQAGGEMAAEVFERAEREFREAAARAAQNASLLREKGEYVKSQVKLKVPKLRKAALDEFQGLASEAREMAGKVRDRISHLAESLMARYESMTKRAPGRTAEDVSPPPLRIFEEIEDVVADLDGHAATMESPTAKPAEVLEARESIVQTGLELLDMLDELQLRGNPAYTEAAEVLRDAVGPRIMKQLEAAPQQKKAPLPVTDGLTPRQRIQVAIEADNVKTSRDLARVLRVRDMDISDANIEWASGFLRNLQKARGNLVLVFNKSLRELNVVSRDGLAKKNIIPLSFGKSDARIVAALMQEGFVGAKETPQLWNYYNNNFKKHKSIYGDTVAARDVSDLDVVPGLTDTPLRSSAPERGFYSLLDREDLSPREAATPPAQQRMVFVDLLLEDPALRATPWEQLPSGGLRPGKQHMRGKTMSDKTGSVREMLLEAGIDRDKWEALRKTPYNPLSEDIFAMGQRVDPNAAAPGSELRQRLESAGLIESVDEIHSPDMLGDALDYRDGKTAFLRAEELHELSQSLRLEVDELAELRAELREMDSNQILNRIDDISESVDGITAELEDLYKQMRSSQTKKSREQAAFEARELERSRYLLERELDAAEHVLYTRGLGEGRAPVERGTDYGMGQRMMEMSRRVKQNAAFDVDTFAKYSRREQLPSADDMGKVADGAKKDIEAGTQDAKMREESGKLLEIYDGSTEIRSDTALAREINRELSELRLKVDLLDTMINKCGRE